jgi:membrane protein involved in colicin uptake
MGGITMKNHLKHHPCLRFVDAPSAETGGDAAPTPDAPSTGADNEAAQKVDWEAEARKWKELSRKNEARMKENAEKAKLYDEAQEQGKSELQKAQEAAAKAEARATALEAKVLRAQVAAAKGVDADLLSGTSQEELEASADRLIAWRGAQTPKGAPSSDAGVRGDEIRAVKQLTREDLKKMSPAEILKARKDGQLNNIMGIA